METVEKFSKATSIELKDEFAESALEEYNLLKKSSFFLAYTDLRKTWLTLHPSIANHLNLLPKWIAVAAEKYFATKFKVTESCMSWKNATDGTRPAIYFNVTVKNTVNRYRIKTNHGAGTGSRGHFSSNRCFSNLHSFQRPILNLI